MSVTNGRSFGIDCLRGLAILLVLCCHTDDDFCGVIGFFGWLGVDLFFVLSGYLIATKLFTLVIYKEPFNLFKFLLSRVFRIAPAFYVFLLVGFTLFYLEKGSWPYWRYVVSDLLFFQNYTAGLFVHVWSLDAEMHFYFLFGCVFYVYSSFSDWYNYHYLIVLLLLFWFVFIIIRIDELQGFKDQVYYVFRTHQRVDGFFVGILVAFFNFKSIVADFIASHKYKVFFVALLLLIPGFVWRSGSYEIDAYGLPFVNVGFGLLLFIVLKIEFNSYWMILLRPFAKLGVVSYSVYLWHLMVREYVFRYIDDSNLENIVFLVLSVIVGVLMYVVFESNFLRLRRIVIKKMF